jgi:hypothetical protein
MADAVIQPPGAEEVSQPSAAHRHRPQPMQWRPPRVLIADSAAAVLIGRGTTAFVLLSGRSLPNQSADRKSIPVREAIIEVQIRAAAAAQFVSANWQWFIGKAIAIGAVVVAVLFHRR